MNKDEDENKELDLTRVDSAVSLAKGIVGAIPYGGALFAEIIGVTIPNQRLDRVVNVLRELDKRLTSVEREQIRSNEYALDLFEDGMYQATGSLTEKRNRYIATFIQKCVGVDEDSYGVKKRLFYILQELTDLDIEILLSLEHGGSSSIRQALYPGNITVGQYRQLSAEEKYDYDSKREAWWLHISTLERHGLVAGERARPDPDDPRYLDETTGLPKILGHTITSLGKVFLQTIGEKLYVSKIDQ